MGPPKGLHISHGKVGHHESIDSIEAPFPPFHAMIENKLQLVSETKAIARAVARERVTLDRVQERNETQELPGSGTAGAVNTDTAAKGDWFYIWNGEEVGPVPLSELLKILLNPAMEFYLKMVWTPGMNAWKPYHEVKTLRQNLPSLCNGDSGAGPAVGKLADVASDPVAADERAKAAEEKARVENEVKLRIAAEKKAAEGARITAVAKAKVEEEFQLRIAAEAKAEQEIRLRLAAEAKGREECKRRAAAEAEAEEQARLRAGSEAKAAQEAKLRAAAESKSLLAERAAAVEKSKVEEAMRVRNTEEVKIRAAAKAKAELDAEVEALGVEDARISALARERATAAEESRLEALKRSKSKAAAKARIKAAKRARFQAAVERKTAERQAKAAAEAKLVEEAEADPDADKTAVAKAVGTDRKAAEIEAAPVGPGKRTGFRALFTKKVWFYSCEGQRLGPVSFRELRNLAAGSSLDPRLDMVWKRGSEDWKAAGEIDGLFERNHIPGGTRKKMERSTASPAFRPARPRSPMTGIRTWPGARRRSLLLVTLVFPFIWQYAMSSGGPFLVGKFGEALMGRVLQVAMFLPLLVLVHFGIKRLVNLGMSRWWLFGLFVPVLNGWVAFRCFACPPGYRYHKKLDPAGIALSVLYAVFLVSAVMYPDKVITPLCDAIVKPALWASVL